MPLRGPKTEDLMTSVDQALCYRRGLQSTKFAGISDLAKISVGEPLLRLQGTGGHSKAVFCRWPLAITFYLVGHGAFNS